MYNVRRILRPDLKVPHCIYQAPWSRVLEALPTQRQKATDSSPQPSGAPHQAVSKTRSRGSDRQAQAQRTGFEAQP